VVARHLAERVGSKGQDNPRQEHHDAGYSMRTSPIDPDVAWSRQ